MIDLLVHHLVIFHFNLQLDYVLLHLFVVQELSFIDEFKLLYLLNQLIGFILSLLVEAHVFIQQLFYFALEHLFTLLVYVKVLLGRLLDGFEPGWYLLVLPSQLAVGLL